MPRGINEVDMKILRMLRKNARIPLSKIAKKLGVSVTAVKKRISKLEKANVITGYHAALNPKKLGYNVIAITGIQVEPKERRKALKRLMEYEGVIEIYEVTGTYDFIVKIVAKNIEHLRTLLAMSGISGILKTETFIILKNYDIIVEKLCGGDDV